MKKLLYIFVLAVAVLTVACTKNEVNEFEGKGAVSFSFPTTRAGEDAEVDPIYTQLKYRIYSHTTSESGEVTKTLVRLYSYEEIKDMTMWLVAGDYSIAVEGGARAAASFTEIYYYGSTEFTLDAGEEKSVAVTCRPKNTMIKVVFDESIAQKMTDAKVVVSIDNSFNLDNITGNKVPYLTYKASDATAADDTKPNVKSKVGFYLLELIEDEDAKKSFAWNFSGKVPSKNNEVDKTGLYTAPDGGFKEGAMYTITFKYSDDLGGYISINVKVTTDVEEIKQELLFKPEPQVTGPGLSGTEYVYAGMAEPISYDIKSIGNLQSVKVKVGDNTYEYAATAAQVAMSRAYVAGADEYFTVEEVSAINWKITFTDKLLNSVAAGSQTVIITAVDAEGVEGEVDVALSGEGTYAQETVDAWSTTAKLKAYVNNPSATDVKILYREQGAETWSEATAEKTLDKVYETTVSGIDGGRTYEYYLKYGDEQKGVVATFQTGGVQIPNGGMEEWQGDSPLLPYIGTQWWDTGNHGAATLGGNVTTNAGARPGSTGQYSAYLKSQFVGVAGIGKFAAGNIFFGKYLATNGTNGTIGFGQPFTFDYKPKKLRVWYKGKVGTCDYAGGSASKGGSDKAQIYVWLCNWTGQHAVNTADSKTFINPETTATTAEGNVLAYGVWSREITDTDNGNDAGWQMLEIPITYREGDGFTGVKPNYLVISCASSGYGDYFAGSTSSYMYVDDFEFVY